MTFLEDIDDDLDSLYDPDFGFAERVETADGYIIGIFESPYYEGDPGTFVGVRTSTPALRTRTKDELAESDEIIIRGTRYTVVEPMPNGYGETIHMLRLA